MAYREEPKVPEVSAEQGQKISIAAQRVGLVIEDVIDLLENGGEHLQFLLASIKENKRLAEFEGKTIPVIQQLTDLKQQVSVLGISMADAMSKMSQEGSRTSPLLRTALTVQDLKQLVDANALGIRYLGHREKIDMNARRASVTTSDNYSCGFSLEADGRIICDVDKEEWEELSRS